MSDQIMGERASAEPDSKAPATENKTEFSLSASESELLQEFGVLLAAEYNYQVM